MKEYKKRKCMKKPVQIDKKLNLKESQNKDINIMNSDVFNNKDVFLGIILLLVKIIRMH